MKTLIGMLVLVVLVGCETVPKQVLPYIVADGQGGTDLYLYDLEAGTSRVLQKTPSVNEYDPSINPTSKRVVYVTAQASTGQPMYQLLIRDLTTGETSEALRSTDPLYSPAFANDSKELAYTVLREGKLQICIKDLTTQAESRTLGFGSSPSWRQDDRAVFYSSADTRDAEAGDFMLYELKTGLNNSLALRGNAFANLPRGTSVAYTTLPYTRRNEAVWLLDANGKQARLTSPGKDFRDTHPVHINGTTFVAFTRNDVSTGNTAIYVVDRYAEEPVETQLFEANGSVSTAGGELLP